MDNLSVKIVLSELSYKALIQAFALLGRTLGLDEGLDDILNLIADEIAFRDGLPPFADDCDKTEWMLRKWDECPLIGYVGGCDDGKPVRSIEVKHAH
ncbi:hypothetical protein S2_145 [Pseudomonas phage vB_PaeM_SCUT-S2]|uniref:hypothetical protein n=1 Tax=Pseudomonas phage C11 TaxID=1735586 RepID=UPI0007067DBE|nr:hypothetical protein AU075_gp077 [Pseudomonas phage C11]ALJ97603.1 hypothetical protein C11_143 [Pseudomonas phage C11]AXC34639.1 polynucleotide kinase-phosphatase [Pseudomonas phage SRT6]AXY86865.1 hypothetical protein PaYy2_71 [Pseudomonas phage PaYy-2]QAU05417.1 hypothetical protein S2_145 [Pseudomonas phage vB_PaeM_SCUT-S2]